MSNSDKIVAKIGMRILVSDCDDELIGFGTITKVETHIISNTSIIIDYPSEITLDNGSITEGIECWWIPIDRFSHNELSSIYRYLILKK